MPRIIRVKKAGYIRPSRSDVHVNRPLTNVSLAIVQGNDGFVASRVFQNISVSKQSDLYFSYPRDDWNRDEMRERAPGTESAGIGYAVGNDTYYCRVRSLHRDIPDQLRANADDEISLDTEATRLLTLKGLISRELRWANTYFKTGVWGEEVTGVNADPVAGTSFLIWNDANSTPIEDIRAAKRAVQEATGFRPNVLTLGRPVFDALLDHPDIVGRLNAGQTPGGPAIVNRQALAALFELDEVLVMDAIYNSAKQGATAAHSFIGGSHALLTYRPQAPGLMTPAAGYTFSWTGYLGATEDGMRVKRFRMDHLESDRIELDMAYDQKLVSNALGFFFKDAIGTLA